MKTDEASRSTTVCNSLLQLSAVFPKSESLSNTVNSLYKCNVGIYASLKT